jgi:hypothetical protein
MRNANAQRLDTMTLGSAMRQAPEPHVSHAEIGYPCSCIYVGQRCALLTMKSRNTWTRATVFNSSG